MTKATSPKNGADDMTLATGVIYRLWSALDAIENSSDIKLAADVRFKVAINVSRLHPMASAYERARAGMVSQAYGEARESLGKDWPAERPMPLEAEARVQSSIIEQDHQLLSVMSSVELRTLLRSDLRLDDNSKKIKLSALLPIIDDAE